jgi:enediyne core biosynthesis thioesterase
MKYYTYEHVVGFEETNLVGNVYFANHVKWQGRVREMFLKDHAIEVLDLLKKDLVLVTTKVSCEYFSEIYALDVILIKMNVQEIKQNKVTMGFDYINKNENKILAKGEQQIACMKKAENGIEPTNIPLCLERALNLYSL